MILRDCPDHIRFQWETSTNSGVVRGKPKTVTWSVLTFRCETCGHGSDAAPFVSGHGRWDHEAQPVWDDWFPRHKKCPETPRFGVSLVVAKEILTDGKKAE